MRCATEPTRATPTESDNREDSACGEACVKQWYALRTRRNHERIAHSALHAMGFESYLPMISERRRWTHRVVMLSTPFFPGYLFTRVELDRRVDVLNMRGVVEILGTHTGPTPIPPKQIASIQILEQSMMPYVTLQGLVEGTPVRVISGPMLGAHGIFQTFARPNRLVIGMPILGRSVAVEMDSSVVEVLRAPHESTDPLTTSGGWQ